MQSGRLSDIYNPSERPFAVIGTTRCLPRPHRVTSLPECDSAATSAMPPPDRVHLRVLDGPYALNDLAVSGGTRIPACRDPASSASQYQSLPCVGE